MQNAEKSMHNMQKYFMLYSGDVPALPMSMKCKERKTAFLKIM